MASTTTPRASLGRLAGPRVRIFEHEARLGYLLLIPALLLLLVFVAYPFLFGIWLSITNSQIGVNGHFIGLANFQFEQGDSVFIQSFVTTISYTGITTVFKLALGMWLGLIAPAFIINYGFEQRPFALYWINIGQYLVGMLLCGLIVGAWTSKAGNAKAAGA